MTDGKKVLQAIDELQGRLSQDQKDAIIDYARGYLRNPNASGIDLDALDIDLEPIKIELNGLGPIRRGGGGFDNRGCLRYYGYIGVSEID